MPETDPIDVPPLELTTAENGVKRGIFADRFGGGCVLKSSHVVDEPMVYLGVSATASGMFLTRPMAAALLPHLRRFVETGEL